MMAGQPPVELELGYFRRDEDCHWYLIPRLMVDEFDDLMEAIEGKEYLDAMDDFSKFEAKFGEYRCNDPCDSLVIMNDIELD